MPRHKGIGQTSCNGRAKRRKQHVTLRESRLGKKTYTEHVEQVNANFTAVVAYLEACDPRRLPVPPMDPDPVLLTPPPARNPKHPLPANPPPAPKASRDQRRPPLNKPLSSYKHPRRKLQRIQADLDVAFHQVMVDHGVMEDDLPTIRLHLAKGETMLAKLVQSSGWRPELIVTDVGLGITVDVRALVKVMDTHAISRAKINALRHVLPDVPSDARIRDETAALDAEVETHLGLYWTPDSAGVDPKKVIIHLLKNGLIPTERRLLFSITGDGKSTGRKMKSTSLGMQCLNHGKEVALTKNFFVLLTIRGGEKFEDLDGKLDALEDSLVELRCNCSLDNPCGDDCEDCLEVDGNRDRPGQTLQDSKPKQTHHDRAVVTDY